MIWPVVTDKKFREHWPPIWGWRGRVSFYWRARNLNYMQVSSSKENRAAEIDQCLTLLSPSSSDESKFTALLILPRLLDSNDHATIQRVFDKMNFKFIERLMKSSTSSAIIYQFWIQCVCTDFLSSFFFFKEKTAEVPETVMQEIAVNILSYFSTVESLTSSEQLIARIPTLSSCIKPRYKMNNVYSDFKSFVQMIWLNMFLQRPNRYH